MKKIIIPIIILSSISIVVLASVFVQPQYPSSPTGYTLKDIDNLITNNTLATIANHSLSTTSVPIYSNNPSISTIYTKLYNLIQPENLKSGVTYLGVTGGESRRDIITVATSNFNPTNSIQAQGYTLEDIYNLIHYSTTTTQTAGNHSLTLSNVPASSMYSISSLYNDLVNLMQADNILQGITYLGVVGSYAPVGSALNFNGAGYVIVDYNFGFGSFDDGLTPFSLSAWVKLDNPPVDSYNIIMAKQKNVACAAPGYSFGILNGKLVAWFWNHACDHFTMSVESTDVAVNNSEWVYVTMTYSGSGVASGIKLYVNGEEYTTQVVSYDNLSGRSIQSAAPFSIGAMGDGQWMPIFKGTIDQPLVFGRVLSQFDILDLYNDGLGVYGDISNPIFSGLLAGWNFDEGSGYVMEDFSGNGNLGREASSNDYFTQGIVSLP